MRDVIPLLASDVMRKKSKNNFEKIVKFISINNKVNFIIYNCYISFLSLGVFVKKFTGKISLDACSFVGYSYHISLSFSAVVYLVKRKNRPKNGSY